MDGQAIEEWWRIGRGAGCVGMGAAARFIVVSRISLMATTPIEISVQLTRSVSQPMDWNAPAPSTAQLTARTMSVTGDPITSPVSGTLTSGDAMRSASIRPAAVPTI